MKVLEAKDFLVQQTAEQAVLENMPLSDLEKRMMYFTETGECPENPIALNDAFEAEYDTDEYEAKISKLMRHAHSRVKKDNPEATRKWKEAIQELSKGDHYILILCNEGLDLTPGVPTKRPPYDQLITIACWPIAGGHSDERTFPWSSFQNPLDWGTKGNFIDAQMVAAITFDSSGPRSRSVPCKVSWRFVWP